MKADTERAGGVTRDLVLRVASRLFHERGYAGTSLRDIAAAIGVSAPALYWHFSSKSEILFEIVKTLLEQSLRTIQSQVVSESASDRLREYCRAHVREVLSRREDVELNRATALGIPPLTFSERQRAELTRLERNYTELVRGILDDGIASGKFRPVDVTATAFIITCLCDDSLPWYAASQRLTVDEVAELVADLALRMVLARLP